MSCRAFMSARPLSAAPDREFFGLHFIQARYRAETRGTAASVYNCSGGTAAETISLTRRSYSTSINHRGESACQRNMLTGIGHARQQHSMELGGNFG